MIVKQYRVRYRDNQYTKVNTVNIVPANSAGLEVDPEDDDLTIGDIEEDTGLTQQPRKLHPAPQPEEVPGTHREHPDTPPSPWSDPEDKNDPEYPEQSDDPEEHSGNSSPTKGNTGNALDPSQSQPWNKDTKEELLTKHDGGFGPMRHGK